MQRVREAAEKAKIELSGMMQTSILLPFIASDRNGPKNLEMTLTRAKFDALTQHLVLATQGPVEQAIRDAEISANAISKVLMVGVSSRIPAVNAFVKKMTGKELFNGIYPDEVVAMGAAIQSGVLSGTVKGLLLLDVTPLSLGIETVGDNFAKVIDRNTTIPITKSRVFSTAAPYQRSVEIHVLQGERERASGNKDLGRFSLNGIRLAPAGVPQIEVTFDIDANGIVHVSARDLDTGRMQDITITASGNLSQEEIAQAIADAKRYAAEDAILREESETRRRAESVMNRANTVMKNNRKSKAALGELTKRLKKALKGKDTTEISAAADALEQEVDTFDNGSMKGQGGEDIHD